MNVDDNSTNKSILRIIRDAIWNYPYTIWEIIQKLQKLKVITIISVTILGCFVFFSLLFNLLQSEKGYANTLFIGVVDSTSTYNPLLSNTLSRTINKLVFNQLYWLDNQDIPHPRLAKSWDILSTDNTIVFHLQNDILWQDGVKFSADDVIFSFNLQKKLSQNTALDKMTIQKIDNVTISVAAGNIDVNMWQDLSWPIFPHHTVVSYDEEIGTGAYTLVRHDSSGFYLISNQKYFLGEPKIANIQIKVYKDQQSLYDAYVNGEVNTIDIIDPIYPFTQEKINKHNDFSYNQPFITNYNALFFNITKVTNTDIRKGIYQGINTTGLVPFLPEDTLMDSPFAKNSWAHSTNTEIPRYAYSLQNALNSLKNAGYSVNDAKQLVDKNGNPLRLQFAYLNGSIDTYILQEIKSSFMNMGISLFIQSYDYQNWVKHILNGKEFDIAYIQVQGGVDPDPFGLWYSSSKDNISQYKNETVDRYLDLARITSNISQRQRAYTLFQKTLMGDAPSIFLYNPDLFIEIKPNITGIHIDKNLAFEADIFNNVQEWFIQ